VDQRIDVWLALHQTVVDDATDEWRRVWAYIRVYMV